MLSRNPASLLIVAVYLIALFYLFLSGAVEPKTPIVGVLYFFGISLALWAGWTLRTTSWRITPEVANNAILIENGPYTYLRHPMYLALILVALGLLINDFTTPRLLVFLIIVGDLLLKIHYEEILLHRSFSRYKDYLKKTYRLLPFVY
jgi:protein-S-isoprenylcysteine O-methyltransferase Ste14